MSATAALVAQLFESVDSGFDNIVRVVRADGLSEYVRNADGLNDRAHRTAGDDAGSFGRGLQQHETTAKTAKHRVKDGRFENVHLAEVLLGRPLFPS